MITKGNTVNMASRIESTSQPYRIHVSESSMKLLTEIGGYKLEYRGQIELTVSFKLF
jgi:class 3 adenylate cyclase